MSADGAPDFQSGDIDPTTLKDKIVQLVAWIRRVFNLEAQHPFDREDDGGLFMRDTRPIMARLRGTAGTGSNPYGWDEVRDNPSTFSTISGGRSSDHDGNAYEVNGGTGLGHKIVKLRPSQVHDWRFTDDRWNVPCAGQICFGVYGCFGTPIAGASIGVTGPGGFSASCTTNAAGICCLAITASGSYAVNVSATDYDAQVGLITAACSNNTLNFSLTPTLPKICVYSGGCCAQPMPPSITITDANGAHSAASFGGGGYRVVYDLSTANGQVTAPYVVNPAGVPTVYYKGTVTGQIEHTIALGCLNPTTISCFVTTRWTAPDYSSRFLDFTCNASAGIPGAGGELIGSPYVCNGGNFGDELVGLTYRMVDKSVIGISPPVNLGLLRAGCTFSGTASIASACLATGVSISCFGGVAPGGGLRNFPDYIGNPVVISW
jgi:hypothetical protein